VPLYFPTRSWAIGIPNQNDFPSGARARVRARTTQGEEAVLAQRQVTNPCYHNAINPTHVGPQSSRKTLPASTAQGTRRMQTLARSQRAALSNRGETQHLHTQHQDEHARKHSGKETKARAQPYAGTMHARQPARQHSAQGNQPMQARHVAIRRSNTDASKPSATTIANASTAQENQHMQGQLQDICKQP
jgi:hypothetical protein